MDDYDEFPEMSTINEIQLPNGSTYGFEDIEARDKVTDITSDVDELKERVNSLNLSLANKASASDLTALQNNVPANSAWAHGRLDGTTVNLMFSHNVESISTTSDGHTFYVKFSNPFPDEYYAAVASFEIGGIGQEIVGVYGYSAAGFSVDVQNASGNANTPTCISVIALR